MATPPVIRDTQQSTWSDAGGAVFAKTIAALSIQSGDMLIVRALTETSADTLAITNDGSALAWTQRQMFGATGNQCRGYIWSATGDSTRSLVITLTCNNANQSFGGLATSFSAHGGLGLSTGGATNGTASLTLACSANSWVGCVDGDWLAGGGADTWLTNAGAFTERVDYSDPAKYDVYAGDHLDCGAAATYTLGMSAPDPQNWSLGAIEVLGTAGGAAITDVAFVAQLEQVGNRRLSPGLIGPGKDTFGDFS